MPKGGDFLRYGFAKAFDPELRGVVQRIARVGNLSAVRGNLDDAAAPSAAHVGKRRADRRDGAEEVGRHDGVDVIVGELFSGAEKTVARVVDEDVEAPELFRGAVHGVAQGLAVAHVER